MVPVVNENVMNVEKHTTLRETTRGGEMEEVMLRKEHFTLAQETLPQKMVRPY